MHVDDMELPPPRKARGWRVIRMAFLCFVILLVGFGWTDLLRAHRMNRISVTVMHAQSLTTQGDVQALAILYEVARVFPAIALDYRFHEMRGDIHSRLGKADQADRDYGQALACISERGLPSREGPPFVWWRPFSSRALPLFALSMPSEITVPLIELKRKKIGSPVPWTDLSLMKELVEERRKQYGLQTPPN